MTTLLIDLSPGDMRTRIDEAISVYVDAMSYPRGTEGQRTPMWIEHTRRDGWRAVAAVEEETATLLGIAYGYRGAPDHWWQQQVVRGLRQVGSSHTEISALMGNYFELTELHIRPNAQGHGLGEALARRLLADRTEAHVLLSTPETTGEPNRAWRLYRRLGFTDVIRGYHFAGDPRAFAVLGRALPL